MIPTETLSAPSRQNGGNAARWFAFAGVGGPILFVLVFTLAGFLRPGYSPLSQAVSDLGVGPNAWLQNANFVVFGLLLIAFAIGFYQGMRSVISRGWLVACLVLLMLSGVGIINGGIFKEDPTTRVLITGASRGLGRALVEVLTKRGHKVIASARHIADLADLQAASKVTLDMTNPALIAAALAEIGE